MQEPTLKAISKSELRRPSLRNGAFGYTDVQAGDAVSFFRQIGRKSAPEWRGPAGVMDLADAGVAAKRQGRTLKVAPHCLTKREGPKVVADANWGPSLNSERREATWPSSVEIQGVAGESSSKWGTGGHDVVTASRATASSLVGRNSPAAPSHSLSAQSPPRPPYRPTCLPRASRPIGLLPKLISPSAPRRTTIP